MALTQGEGRTLAAIVTDLEPENVQAYVVLAVRRDTGVVRIASDLHPLHQVPLMNKAMMMTLMDVGIVLASPDDDE